MAAVCGTIAPDIDLEASGLVDAIAVSDGLPPDVAMDPAGTLMRVANAVRDLLTTRH